MSDEQQEIENEAVFERWRNSPVAFVEECLGVRPDIDPKNSITNQQRDGLIKLGMMVNAKIRASSGEEMGAREIGYSKKIGISIMSGHGTGKDAYAAWAILWFIVCFTYPKIPCTAPNADQLQSVLWSEISKWMSVRDKDGNYVCPIRDDLEFQSRKLFMKNLPDKSEKPGARWFAEARTVSPNQNEEKQAETLAGRHEDYMMYLVDEASGVPDAVFRPFEGTLTGICNFIIMIFNPTHRSGFAYNSHYGKKEEVDQWIKLHWDGEESDRVSKEQIERLADKHGRDSNYFLVRVKGLPPQSDEDSLIPDAWVYAAQKRTMEPDPKDPVFMGVDCAMGGGDEAAIAIRKGPKVEKIYTFVKSMKTHELGTKVIDLMVKHEVDMCFIDPIGVGKGVYDYVSLFSRSEQVQPVDVRDKAYDNTRFYRLRDELWWKMRTAFEKGLVDIPASDGELRSQLSSIKYESSVQHLGNSLKIESKSKMKVRGRGSPDRADALMITYMRDSSVMRMDRDEDLWADEPETALQNSWMTA